MKTLARSVETAHQVGRPIPLPWPNLSQYAKVYTRELIMVAGAPGGGKSMVAVNLATSMREPMIYFSMDSADSVRTRMAAIASNRSFSDVRHLLTTQEGATQLSADLTDWHQQLVLVEGRKSPADIEQHILAMEEWIGRPPTCIFIDNLMDMKVDGFHPAEPGFYSTVLPILKETAWKHDVAIFVLHHVTKGGERDQERGAGRGRVRMTDLLYAGDREARHVWGVYNDGQHTIWLEILKQQDGHADPAGSSAIRLRWIPEMSKVIG